MAILAIHGDAAQVMRRQHICPMARTIDPSCHGTLDTIYLSIIVGHILGEAPLEKWHFLTSNIEVGMTYRYFSVCHGDTVLHRDVVQCLIP